MTYVAFLTEDFKPATAETAHFVKVVGGDKCVFYLADGNELATDYRPDQPRAPKGRREGGRFVKAGASKTPDGDGGE